MIRQQKAQQVNSSSQTKSIQIPTSPVIETCAYQLRPCNQPVLEDYDYCMKHILEDKNAPYKPCGYAYPINNKRCLLPAPRGDKRDVGYCPLHMWKTQMKRQRTLSKRVPPPTPEALLATLSHYVRPSKTDLKPQSEDVSHTSRTKALNPFVEVDIAKVTSSRTHVLECASESDSDVETATLDNIWKGANEDSSDAESIDSLDDPLRHAGYYTAEEVVQIAKTKLTRLQFLYNKQFERLTYVLKEKRRRYLLALKKERETLSSISDQARTSAKEQKLYEKLKALNRYQRRSNAERIAYFASLEKRAKELAGSDYKPHPSAKCNFTEGGVRCSKVILPFTKFCFKHILEDPNQSLFKACGCEKADIKCHEPISNLGPGETCILHIKLPTLPHHNLPEIKLETVSNLSKQMEESELDASATESAFSTDNRDSPDDLANSNDDRQRKDKSTALFDIKLNFTEEIPKKVPENLQKEKNNSLAEVNQPMDVVPNGSETIKPEESNN